MSSRPPSGSDGCSGPGCDGRVSRSRVQLRGRLLARARALRVQAGASSRCIRTTGAAKRATMRAIAGAMHLQSAADTGARACGSRSPIDAVVAQHLLPPHSTGLQGAAMFQALVQKAEGAVSSAVGAVVWRAAVAVPLIIGAGFGIAAATEVFSQSFGPPLAYTMWRFVSSPLIGCSRKPSRMQTGYTG
jgi:hypothetical protein